MIVVPVELGERGYDVRGRATAPVTELADVVAVGRARRGRGRRS